MPGSNMKFTMIAGQAMDFASSFNQYFAAGVPGPVHHTVDLTTPSGPSTAGGKQVLQHIRLLPAGGGAAIVIGSMNGVERTVEIRTYDSLAAAHRQRFKGAAFPVPRAAHQGLVDGLHRFFESQGFRVTVTSPASLAPPPAGAGSSPGWGIIAAVFLALGAIAGVIFFVVRARLH